MQACMALVTQSAVSNSLTKLLNKIETKQQKEKSLSFAFCSPLMAAKH